MFSVITDSKCRPTVSESNNESFFCLTFQNNCPLLAEYLVREGPFEVETKGTTDAVYLPLCSDCRCQPR